jgi:hypothetical protein
MRIHIQRIIIAKKILSAFSKIQTIKSKIPDQYDDSTGFSAIVAVLTLIARTSGNVINIKMIPIINLFIVPY